MLVVNRFHVPDDEAASFLADLESARDVLAVCAGHLESSIGRNLDDQGLWVLVTRWRDVGSYRRALSSYDVKVGVVPLLSRSVDEPSAYEDVAGGNLNENLPRGGH
ncbi:MAG TPA: antibiotic biosynthesis monooxygenase family protein [Marmoricola sp.]|nr:antibiotic biosynthesis monooxygenase family protein [Marmoricola sp.]